MVKFFLIILFFTTSLFSSSPTISLELADIHFIKKNKQIEPTAFLGEPFRIKAVISGSDEVTGEVEIEGLENFINQGQSMHSTSSKHNSKIFQEKTISYNLLPQEEGAFQIGPASFIHNGKTLESNTVALYVSRKTEKFHDAQVSKKIKQNNDAGYELFCTLKAEKKTAFIEEPILITLSIYQRGNISGIRGLRISNFPNCTVKEIKEIDEFKKELENKTYLVREKKIVIFPGKPGKIQIFPAQVVYTVQKKKRQQKGFGFVDEGFFSNFFDFGTEQKVAVSNSLEITVKDLPATTKDSDGIGTFSSIESSVDKTETYINEPIKFKLSLSGLANFDLILAPELNLPKNFKSYESKVETLGEKTGREGTKTFEYILQIPKPGAWTIPEQTFNYFDTKTRSYKTLRTKPIKIDITIPEGAESSVPQIPSQKSVSKSEQEVLHDINFIEEDVPTKAETPFYLNFLFFILTIFLTPLFFYLKEVTLFVKKRFWVPLASKLFVSRKNILIKYQKQITNLIENNDPGKFYSLFINFLSELYGVSKNKIDENDGFDAEKTDSFMKFLNECAGYSFGSTKISEVDFKNFEKKANYWLLFIYQNFKK